MKILGLVLTCCTTLAAAADDETRLSDRCLIRFASVNEATPVMTAHDDFIASLSRFDLEARLHTNQDVSVEKLLEHIPKQIREWSAAEKKQLSPALANVAERLRNWDLPFPETVLLIKTTGREDADKPYSRGNAIVFPESYVAHVSEQVLLHELFHVLSRANPELRQKLYAVVGFTIDQEILLPESLRDIKLTNPDAPSLNCYVQLTHEDRELNVTPLLSASAEHFDPQPGRTLFDHLRFHLLVVEQQEGNWHAKLDENGAPILLDVQSVPAYFEKIGRNTEYIIHPEEVLADNFVLLVTGKFLVPSPRVVMQMAEVLKPAE